MSGQDSLPSNQCGECAKLHAQIERLQELLGSALKLLDDARPVMDADMTVDFQRETTPRDVVTVVATRPLTDNEAWTVMLPGTLAVFSAGAQVAAFDS